MEIAVPLGAPRAAALQTLTTAENLSILEFELADEAATRALGGALAGRLRPGDLILLEGDLGAGKTALARALVQAHLAAHGLAEDVPSPTFTLVQTYESPALLIAHVDHSRIEDASALRTLALHAHIHEGVGIVEWPARADRAISPHPRACRDIPLAPHPVGIRPTPL